MSEERVLSEQAVFLFFGIIIGLIVGVFGNLWADAIFEYLAKGDRSIAMTNTLIIISGTLLAMIVVLTVATYGFYKRCKKHNSLL